MSSGQGRMKWWGGALLVLAASVAPVVPAAAQQRPAAPDTSTKTPAQRVQERLRNLRPVAAPDTVQPEDTLPPRQRAGAVSNDRAAAQPAADASIQRDSLMEALAALAGFVATEYKGEEAQFKADSGQLELKRDAVVFREGQRLQADSLVTYNEGTGIACGYGKPTATGAAMQESVVSDTLCYDIHNQRGRAIGAETTISQGASWRIKGDLYPVGENTLFGHDVMFTDCDIPWPHQHYHFAAKDVKVMPNNVLVGKNVTMNFADVPVFWLPFMVQSLSRGRRSGILMPRFGINDIARNSSSYNRRIEDVGFYWAINDYMGAEVAMDWMSNNYTALRGSLDYSVVRQFLNGGLTFRRYFPSEGGNQFTVSSQNSWQPDERTRMSMSANYSTSARFVRQRTLDPRELTRSIDSNFNLNRQFNWGSLTLGGTRNQYLTDGSVRMTLPSFGLNLSSVTLFAASPGEERWYSNATWNGSIDGRLESNKLGNDNTQVSARDRRNLSSNLSSSFTLGKFGVSQGVQFTDEQLDGRIVTRQLPSGEDTIVLADSATQRITWNTGFSFQQNLIGTTTTFTPSLSLGGEILKNAVSEGRLVSSPMRVNFSAAIQTALFGFWPGVGPFAAIRHRLSPSASYTYSPEPTADEVQRRVFAGFDSLGRSSVRERNVLTIGINQTFEGKRRPRTESEREGGLPGDTSALAAADTAAGDTASGPRRLPQGEAPVILLSINTDAVVYDFVAARERNRGIQTQSISNSLQSDLLRNLQLRFTHDLWRIIPATPGTEGAPGTEERREFAPHLSNVSASITLNSDSWLFRALGLGGSKGTPSQQAGEVGTPMGGQVQAGPAIDRTRSENGLVGTRRRDPIGPTGGPLGSWNASLSYTMNRPRTSGGIFDSGENQMITGTFSFQPTENWTLNWNTGYNITVGGFTDHMLTLTRRLHDWDANFDFAKVQNGNLSFQFRVALRANPDIKLDYEQHDLNNLGQQRFR